MQPNEAGALLVLCLCTIGCPSGKGAIVDADADGFSASEDCDDSDPGVNPDVAETCDGLDQDCDGETDEGTLYEDADGDGHGDPDRSGGLCEVSEAAVASGDDCDETDASAYPGATEIWYDGIDQDCSGGSDYDADADGHDSNHYGGRDCDDTDPDKVDDPDDTTELGAGPDCGTLVVGARLYGEEEGSNAGFAISGDGDINGDGFDDLLVMAAEMNYGDTSVGATYVVLGPVTAEQSLGVSEAQIQGPEDAQVAWSSLMGPSDLDGDGYDDVALVTYSADYTYTLRAFDGPLSGDVKNDEADGQWSIDGYFGYYSADAGDVDADGHQDVLIGTCDPTGTGPCSASLISGPLDGEHTMDEATAVVTDSYGYWTTCEQGVDGDIDVNADGYDDVIVACGSWGVGLFEGPVTGYHEVIDADALVGLGVEGVRGAGDTNGDGYDDVLMSRQDPEGEVRAYKGEVSLVDGPLASGDVSDLATATWEGTDDECDTSIAAGSVDVDADGLTDIALKYYVDGFTSGEVQAIGIALSPVSGDNQTDDFDCVLDDDGRHVGYSIPTVSAGDINADGFDDLAISEKYASAYAYEDGVAWLIFGGSIVEP